MNFRSISLNGQRKVFLEKKKVERTKLEKSHQALKTTSWLKKTKEKGKEATEQK
jgi:hypothetical protein